MITLYQFPISHYCEKVRWALEYKKLDYKKINLLPGLHAKQAKKLSGKPYLPILVDNGQIVYESRDILDYLDSTYSSRPLTPQNEALKAQASEWEQFADKELGPDVRRLCYNTLLDHPDITIPFFTTGGPWYSKLLLKFMFPNMSNKMRELMKLDKDNIAEIEDRLSKALEKIQSQTKNNAYLVGDSFTRADLTIASLLAPLFRPNKYGLSWPQEYPEPLKSSIKLFGDKLDWADQIYRSNR